LILAAVWLSVAGCNSIYDRTQKVLPPEPGAQQTMRTEAARRAENLAAQTCTRLHEDLARGASKEIVQADLDRLEVAAFDLQRRTSEVREPGTSAKETPALTSEMERLRLRSKTLLDYVRAAREADAVTQLARLDDLLRSPAAPATR
jgi:hypothetical protein